jgi:hypothetical protein
VTLEFSCCEGVISISFATARAKTFIWHQYLSDQINPNQQKMQTNCRSKLCVSIGHLDSFLFQRREAVKCRNETRLPGHSLKAGRETGNIVTIRPSGLRQWSFLHCQCSCTPPCIMIMQHRVSSGFLQDSYPYSSEYANICMVIIYSRLQDTFKVMHPFRITPHPNCMYTPLRRSLHVVNCEGVRDLARHSSYPYLLRPTAWAKTFIDWHQ